jgi:hypothetical protein
MPDIISAKCFGCGHVVKVPAQLGGKKARCPKCTNTITIPELADSPGEFVSDEQLPEVARDGEILEGEEVVEGEEAPVEGAPEPPTERRRRRGSSGTNPKVDRRGAPPRYGASRKKSSSAGLYIGIGIGVVVLIAIIAAAASSGGGKKDRRGGGAGTPEAGGGSASTQDPALEARCEEFLRAYKNANIPQLAAFFGPESGQDRSLNASITRMIEDKRYDSASVKSADTSGNVVLLVGDREAALRWKQVDGTWYVAERP